MSVLGGTRARDPFDGVFLSLSLSFYWTNTIITRISACSTYRLFRHYGVTIFLHRRLYVVSVFTPSYKPFERKLSRVSMFVRFTHVSRTVSER